MRDFKKTTRLKEGDRINVVSRAPFGYTAFPLDEDDVYIVTGEDIVVLNSNRKVQFKDGRLQPL